MLLQKITRKKLKIAFTVHFVCAMFALLAWPNSGFLFVNLLFHFCMIWSMSQPTMVEPTIMTGLINILSIIFEIVLLGVFWPGKWSTHSVMFSAVMVIVNLIARIGSSTIIFLDIMKLMGSKDPPHKIDE